MTWPDTEHPRVKAAGYYVLNSIICDISRCLSHARRLKIARYTIELSVCFVYLSACLHVHIRTGVCGGGHSHHRPWHEV